MDARKKAIAERLALPVKELVDQLIDMARRGLVWIDPAHKVPEFRLAPCVVGMYEM